MVEVIEADTSEEIVHKMVYQTVLLRTRMGFDRRALAHELTAIGGALMATCGGAEDAAKTLRAVSADLEANGITPLN